LGARRYTLGRVAVEAAIRGEGLRLVLRVHGYESPSIKSGEDANWLTAEVELTVGTYGTYRATQRVSLYARDIAAFAGELRALDRDLTGQAELRHLEGEVAATIKLEDGKGTLTGYVREHVFVKLSFRDIAIDQSYVREAREQFDALLNAFPAR
jgi:hypothetical protein